MDFENHKDYLRDLGFLIKQEAFDARERYKLSKGAKNELYDTGYLMGLHRVVSLMQQQLDGFQLSVKDISMDDFDPDSDLF